MSGSDRNRRRVLTRDERVLWSVFTEKIEPLRPGLSPTDDTEFENVAPDAAPAAPATAKSVVAPPAPPKSAPPLAPLDRRLKKRVARGKAAIDARLDLHGLTQSEAHAALLHFLRAASARGARLVLVITGKGMRGDGESGVLRRQVPQWLALPDFRHYVVGYETAAIGHGGEGALYVRVRRPRHQ